MEHMEAVCSSEFKLFLITLCSIGSYRENEFLKNTQNAQPWPSSDINLAGVVKLEASPGSVSIAYFSHFDGSTRVDVVEISVFFDREFSCRLSASIISLSRVEHFAIFEKLEQHLE